MANPSAFKDIAFALSECVRLQRLMEANPDQFFKTATTKRDALYTITLPSNQGLLICGREAEDRLIRLASTALSASPYRNRMKTEHLLRHLKIELGKLFASETVLLTQGNAQKAVNEAIRVASRECVDRTHFVPCRLLYVTDPPMFRIGQVQFHSYKHFQGRMDDLLSRYTSSHSAETALSLANAKVTHLRDYYQAFNWIAEVTVTGCAPNISFERALLAVETSVNFLRALFGSHPTRRMTVSGPPLPHDDRGHVCLNANGRVELSRSSSATSAVAFDKGWADMLYDPSSATFLEAATRLTEVICATDRNAPVALRLIDSLKWFGDSTADQSSASKVIKAVTAIENLVLTGERDGLAELVSGRTAALRCSFGLNSDFTQAKVQTKRYYDLRSRLAHGALSPLSPVVLEQCWPCVQFAGETIGAALSYFSTAEVILTDMSSSRLASIFNALVESQSGCHLGGE